MIFHKKSFAGAAGQILNQFLKSIRGARQRSNSDGDHAIIGSPYYRFFFFNKVHY